MQATDQIPQPEDPDVVARWDHTRLRRRMLYGEWRRDLEARVIEHVGAVVAEQWGVGATAADAVGGVDLHSNALKAYCDQVSVLYDRTPFLGHQDAPEAAEFLTDLLERAGWSPLMQTVQRDTIGLREMFVAVQVRTVGEQLDLVLRPVFPDVVIASAHISAPDVPVRVEEVARRTHPPGHPKEGKPGWYWDKLDVSDLDNPTYEIVDAETGVDWGPVIAGEPISGEAYPYRLATGVPFLPYVLYHARKTGRLFDPRALLDVVEGTLNAGVNWSHTLHAMTHAGHPVRGTIGAELAGEYEDANGDGHGARRIQADATFVLQLTAERGFTGTPTTFQWGPGAEIDKMMDVSDRYDCRVLGSAASAEAGILRKSGDPRSGYALAIDREQKREASRAYEPTFKAADLQLLTVIAASVNLAQGRVAVPESGYAITYQALPLSKEERKAVLDEVERLLDRGLISVEEAHTRLHNAGIVLSNTPPARAPTPAPPTPEDT
jgi:hypothetical protein